MRGGLPGMNLGVLRLIRDRLASAVRFLRQSEDDVLAGSTAMRRSVVAEATAEIDRLSLEDAVQPGIAWRSLSLAGAACAASAAAAPRRPMECSQSQEPACPRGRV